jgi:hypothetical protein
MWLYLCYILTRTFILAEVITLIKNDNVTCVLTGDSVYSGLYISSFEDQKGKHVFTYTTLFYFSVYRIQSITKSSK